jgi:hypothetical protein
MEPRFKPRGRRAHLFNPIGPATIPDNDEDYEDVDEDHLTKATTIIEKLKSFDPKIREMAAVSLSQLNDKDNEVVERMINQGCIPLLIERLTDPNLNIVLSALMALINLCSATTTIDGQPIALKIIDGGVILMLEAILMNSQNMGNLNADALKVKSAILEYIFRLLASLAENLDEKYLTHLTKSATIACELFLSEVKEFNVLTGILSFLHVLTEGSQTVTLTLADNKLICSKLIQVLENKNTTQEMKAYACGILHNIITTIDQLAGEGKLTNANAVAVYNIDVIKKVIESIWCMISIKIFDEIDNLKKIYELHQKHHEKKPRKKPAPKNIQEELRNDLDAGDDEMGMEESKDNEPEHNGPVPAAGAEDLHSEELLIRFREALKIWHDSALGIEICLGILMTIFEDDDDKGFEDEEELVDDDNEIEQTNSDNTIMQEKPNNTNNNGVVISTPKISSFLNVLSEAIGEKFITAIVDKCNSLPQAVRTFLDDANLQSLEEQVWSITNFSMSCLMNLCVNYILKPENSVKFGLEKDKFCAEICDFLWTKLKLYLDVITANQSNPNDGLIGGSEVENEKDHVFNILRFLLLIIQKANPAVGQLIPLIDLLKVKEIVFTVLDNDSKLIFIELLGTRCADRNKITIEENIVVADHMIELLKCDNVEIIGEALNALFDIYSEETYDLVFKEKGFMQILNYGYDVFKMKIKEGKGKLHKEKVKTLNNHLLNLKRFIKYKAEHIGM